MYRKGAGDIISKCSTSSLIIAGTHEDTIRSIYELIYGRRSYPVDSLLTVVQTYGSLDVSTRININMNVNPGKENERSMSM
jgi:hypothetical protein